MLPLPPTNRQFANIQIANSKIVKSPIVKSPTGTKPGLDTKHKSLSVEGWRGQAGGGAGRSRVKAASLLYMARILSVCLSVCLSVRYTFSLWTSPDAANGLNRREIENDG